MTEFHKSTGLEMFTLCLHCATQHTRVVPINIFLPPQEFSTPRSNFNE